MYLISFKSLLCYFIKTNIDYEAYHSLRTFSYGILIRFKCLIFIITCFMQINRNYISIKCYCQIYKKEINFVSRHEF